jgi:dipeptidyl-peptidase 4
MRLRRRASLSAALVLAILFVEACRASAADAVVVSATPVRNVQWRPPGARVTYSKTIPLSDPPVDALYEYNPETRTETLLLNPADPVRRTDEARRLWSLEGAQWSPTGRALLASGSNDLWLVPLEPGPARRLTNDALVEAHPRFSPDGRQVAFVRENNLHIVDLESGVVTAMTRDGSETILNGTLDWVYGEEFRELTGTGRAFEWSPDGRALVSLRLDQSRVPVHPLVDFVATHPKVESQRYPKVGDHNAIPSVFAVSVGSSPASPRAMALPAGAEYVLPEFHWAPDGNTVHVMTLNRAQNEVAVLAWSPETGDAPRAILTERSAAWLNLHEGPRFVQDGREFLWLSERDGWFHAYRYDRTGNVLGPVTRGPWQIEPAQGHTWSGHPFECDPTGEWMYFAATEADPRERQLYRTRLDGSAFERLTPEPGTHSQRLSPDGRYLLDRFSSVAQPPVVRLLQADGSPVAVLHQPETKSAPDVPAGEFLELTAADGARLHARLYKPPNFDPSRKYAVIVDVYGGPQVQLVTNRWSPPGPLQRRLLDEGFLLWSLDNRGSWGRGRDWETSIAGNLGARELADQLEGINYLKSLPFVATDRVGLRGWSYGGYMTLYALTHAPSVFRCGVAGAPVSDWKFYDTIYTERYMKTPAENQDGYRQSSPLAAVDKLSVPLLLIHGTADDNVHIQNSMAFLDAAIAAGRPCELHIQPGQRHGFGGEPSVRFLNDRIVEFFKRHL